MGVEALVQLAGEVVGAVDADEEAVLWEESHLEGVNQVEHGFIQPCLQRVSGCVQL